MRFKIDENLPIELANLLQEAGHNAMTVNQQGLAGIHDSLLLDICQREKRVLITLDLDFADIRAYTPQKFLGIIVLRVNRQDKFYLISVFQKVMPLLLQEPIIHRLWIIEEQRIRIRGED